MTPREKATELFSAYYAHTWQGHKSTRRYTVESMSKSAAKFCAKIAVNEILEMADSIDGHAISYWVEVKEEIEKL